MSKNRSHWWPNGWNNCHWCGVVWAGSVAQLGERCPGPDTRSVLFADKPSAGDTGRTMPKAIADRQAQAMMAGMGDMKNGVSVCRDAICTCGSCETKMPPMVFNALSSAEMAALEDCLASAATTIWDVVGSVRDRGRWEQESVNAFMDEQKKVHHERRERENAKKPPRIKFIGRQELMPEIIANAFALPAPHDSPFNHRVMLGNEKARG